MRLPVKWMAIESIDDGVFSEKSDVVRKNIEKSVLFTYYNYLQWAFGVTCWEVFNGGKVPYGGVAPLNVPTLLMNGERLLMPQNSACSDEMLVVDCKYLLELTVITYVWV